MTQDKKILLQDLCGRLPYGVKIELTWWVMGEGTYINTTLEPDHIAQLLNDEDGDIEIKPYLRPLSSMTEEEQKEFVKFHCVNICPIVITEKLTISNEAKMFEWLNEHHFDYRGLIDRGLAIEVTEDNNPYKD